MFKDLRRILEKTPGITCFFGGNKNKLSISPGGTFEQAIFGKFEKKTSWETKVRPPILGQKIGSRGGSHLHCRFANEWRGKLGKFRNLRNNNFAGGSVVGESQVAPPLLRSKGEGHVPANLSGGPCWTRHRPQQPDVCVQNRGGCFHLYSRRLYCTCVRQTKEKREKERKRSEIVFPEPKLISRLAGKREKEKKNFLGGWLVSTPFKGNRKIEPWPPQNGYLEEAAQTSDSGKK